MRRPLLVRMRMLNCSYTARHPHSKPYGICCKKEAKVPVQLAARTTGAAASFRKDSVYGALATPRSVKIA